MAHQKGDQVLFLGVPGEWRLTDVAEAPETAVRAENKDGESYWGDASDIWYNFHEAARLRASLEKGLEQSVNGDVEYLEDFSKYADD